MAKIGIMSFAHMHAYSYAACLKEIKTCQFAGVWDDDPKRGRAAAKEFGVPFEKSLEKFLARDMDGVIITSENNKHRAMVEAAAAAGKWILCEKPIAPTVEDAKAMIACCKKAKVGLGTAFPCRYIPSLMVARDQIQAGEFGEIVAIHCTNHGSFPGGWFAEPKLSGGGATMDHTVHVGDVLRWILGKEFKKVHCQLGNQFHKKVIKTDDFGAVQFEMEGGIQVSHLASWSRPSCFPTWGDVTFEFIGTKGVLNVDGFNQKIDVYSEAAVKAEWAYWGDNPDLGLVADFVDAVDQQRAPSVTGEDGLAVTKLSVAAYQSAKSGKAVRV